MSRPVQGSANVKPMQSATPPSFLDDWLKKRNAAQASQQPVSQQINPVAQQTPLQPINPVTAPHNAAQAHVVNSPLSAMSQQPQQTVPEPISQPYMQPQQNTEPLSAEPGHIKIQNNQHSSQAEDMIVIDR